MNQDSDKKSPRQRRDDKPKISPKEDAMNRIKGLEASKMESGMTPADITALDRVIAQLQAKLNG